jgi:hypothetical protein
MRHLTERLMQTVFLLVEFALGQQHGSTAAALIGPRAFASGRKPAHPKWLDWWTGQQY